MPTLEESRKQLQDNIRSFIVDGQSKEDFIRDTASDAIQGNIARETLSELGQEGPATGEVIIEEIEEQTDNNLSEIEEQEQTDNSQPQPQPQPNPQPEPSEPSQPLQTVGSPQSNSNSSSNSSSSSSGGVVNRSESGEAPNVIENPAKDNGAVDMGITTVGNNDSGSSTSGDSSMIDSIDPKIIAGVAAVVVFLMR